MKGVEDQLARLAFAIAAAMKYCGTSDATQGHDAMKYKDDNQKIKCTYSSNKLNATL